MLAAERTALTGRYSTAHPRRASPTAHPRPNGRRSGARTRHARGHRQRHLVPSEPVGRPWPVPPGGRSSLVDGRPGCCAEEQTGQPSRATVASDAASDEGTKARRESSPGSSSSPDPLLAHRDRTCSCWGARATATPPPDAGAARAASLLPDLRPDRSLRVRPTRRDGHRGMTGRPVRLVRTRPPGRARSGCPTAGRWCVTRAPEHVDDRRRRRPATKGRSSWGASGDSNLEPSGEERDQARPPRATLVQESPCDEDKRRLDGRRPPRSSAVLARVRAEMVLPWLSLGEPLAPLAVTDASS